MNEAIELKPISVTVSAARKLTGLGNTKLYELIGERKLQTVLIGRRRLILYASLEALMRDGM